MKQIILLLALFVAGFATGRRTKHAAQTPRVETRIDTIYYERPASVAATTRRAVTVNVPRLLFAPAPAPVVAENATAGSSPEIPDNCAPAPSPGSCGSFSSGPGTPSCSFPSPAPERADSVQIALEVQTRTYEDSLYRAQVSGPVVGELGPSLDWIEVYNRTHTITRTQTKRHRFALTAGVGAAYTPRGLQPTVGVQVGVVLWGF